MSRLSGVFIAVGLFLALVSPGSVFSAPSTADTHLKLLDSPDVKTRIYGAKLMAKDEVTDVGLLDKVKEKLLSGYQVKTRDRNHYDEMAYYCKALSASGNMAYMDLLKMVASNTPNRNLKRHAENAQKLLGDNAERKILQASRENWDSSLTDQENRYVQMLRSDKFRLKRDAGKQVYDQPDVNDKVYQVVAEQLLAGVNGDLSDRDSLDAMAWLCKALGRSGLTKYKETLTQVKQETRNKKLHKYADQALRML